jgi:glucose-6-phosphate 1-dehydrogenase
MPAAPVPECDFVVFGGTGDLAMRKLLPALYLRGMACASELSRSYPARSAASWQPAGS